MTVEIPKRLALELFAYAREAERSVDSASHGPEQWALLRDYYGEEKRDALRQMLKQIKPLIPTYLPLLERRQFDTTSFFWLLCRPFVRLANRKKLSWRFARNEIVFIHQSFNYLLDLLAIEPAPPALTLVNLRMDFWACEYLVETRLRGVPELEKAVHIEHFGQSDYIEHVKIKDLLECEALGDGRIDGDAPGANRGMKSRSTNRVA